MLINKNINYKEINLDINMNIEKIEAVWIELTDYKIYVVFIDHRIIVL